MMTTQKRTVPNRGTILRTAGFVLVLIAALGLGGCYWTSGTQQEAGLVLEITRGADGALYSQDLMDPYGFLFAYVIEESVLRQGPAAVEDLFERLDQELESLFTGLDDVTDEAAFQRFIDNFRFDVQYPSAQFQGRFITFRRGASGSNTFRGLNAGTRYLVVVESFGTDYDTGISAGSVGFTVTTVRAGENRTVSLNLDDNYERFYQFLLDQYGFEVEIDEIIEDIEEEEEEEEETVEVIVPGTIRIVLTEDQQSYFGESPLYYDLLDPDTVDFVLDDFPYPAYFWTDYGDPEWWDWYNPANVLDKEGVSIDKIGDRLPLFPVDGEDFTYEITGVSPGRSWKILITTWASRDDDDIGYEYAALFETVGVTSSGETVQTVVLPAIYSGGSSDYVYVAQGF